MFISLALQFFLGFWMQFQNNRTKNLSIWWTDQLKSFVSCYNARPPMNLCFSLFPKESSSLIFSNPALYRACFDKLPVQRKSIKLPVSFSFEFPTENLSQLIWFEKISQARHSSVAMTAECTGKKRSFAHFLYIVFLKHLQTRN